MSIRFIAFGMVIVLIGLFVVAKLLEKKMSKQSIDEAKYAEIIFAHKQNPRDKKSLIEEVSKALHLTQEQAVSKLQKDNVLTD